MSGSAWHGSTLERLECSECGAVADAWAIQSVCHDCTRPYLARYDLARAGQTLSLRAAAERPPGLTRWHEVLPFDAPAPTLGEGTAPLLRADRLDRELGGAVVHVLDESVNPTGSFKALGLAVAVNRAADLGAEAVCLPTAGNAGMALAAYAALRGLEATVVCPVDTPLPFVDSVRRLGGRVLLHRGLIDECGAIAGEISAETGAVNLSTLKEPYRAEGKKTMGYELLVRLGRLPDVIVYPTGGGTGIVGFAKAFAEMRSMGWHDGPLPRLVSVQASGCAPIVRAFDEGSETSRRWDGAETFASGLRVPSAIGDRLVLRALRDSGGRGIAVDDAEMESGSLRLGAATGVLAAPEGGACLAAASRLAAEGWIAAGETVVLVNTGTALSYVRPPA